MDYLEKTFRWFGADFGVSLKDIKQTGATGVVTALHKIPTGEIWDFDSIKKQKEEIEAAGLKWSVVESVNVHESIKTASEGCQDYINNYIKTLSNLAENGIYTVCYNFMPVLDWTRTNLDYKLHDQTSALEYNPLALAAFDLYLLKRKEAKNEYDDLTRQKAKDLLNNLKKDEVITLQNTIMAGLPGTRDVLSLEEFEAHLIKYASINKTQLRENLARFLKAVIPEAQKLGVKMCIHPDDPPYPILGLPRVVSTFDDIKFLLESVPSGSNGLTFCTGSLGARKDNDLVKIFKAFADKVHFLHLRSVQLYENNSFYEANHLEGSAPMPEIMKVIIKEQMRRSSNGEKGVNIPMRPDHGHLLLNDIHKRKNFYPGYSTLGRMKGLAELSGLEMGLRHGIINIKS